jgi:archaellum component FlaG (FlaF/FlaG flagellin family)
MTISLALIVSHLLVFGAGVAFAAAIRAWVTKEVNAAKADLKAEAEKLAAKV